MSDLRGNRTEMAGSAWTKIAALVIVAVVVAAAGVYTYETWPAAPQAHQSVVANNELPSPSPPSETR